ncbi:MAG: hypothetical protein CMH55_10725 [Myxococcales bacterium]|nr:hypothetical protein [Myxococcales bacterium]
MSGLQLGGFQLIEPMGPGLFKAVHGDLQVPAMVRLAQPSQGLPTERLLKAQFAQIRTLAFLHHPGVLYPLALGTVSQEDADRAGGLLKVGMVWSLFERCSGGAVPARATTGWPQLRDLCLDLLDVLALAHSREVIHGNLHPGNVWQAVSKDPRPGYKISDFLLGQAQDLHDHRGLPPGSHACYLAPEVCEARWRDVGPSADLYSLGCLAWTLATGKELYREYQDGPSIRRAQVETPLPGFTSVVATPPGFGGWISLMLRKDPAERFGQAADARNALLQLDKTRVRGSVVRSVAPMPPNCGEPEGVEHPELLSAGLALHGLREVPLVDRDRQREEIWDALVRVRRTARAEAILIHGPAGHGKSRLTEWMVRRAWQRGAADVIKAVHDTGVGPSVGLSPMVARHYRVLGLDRAGVKERLRQRLVQEGVTDAYEWEALTELVYPSPKGQETVRFEQTSERYSLIRRVLERAARQRPVILWVEDVPWGRDALEFIADLLDGQRLASFPLLIVMTARDEALPQQPQEALLLKELLQRPDCRRITVGTLEAADQRKLISEALAVQGEVVDRIEERTHGHPLFAVQIVGDWIERKVLVPTREGFEVSGQLDATLPSDIHGVWMQRVEKLLAVVPAEARSGALGSLHQAAALGIEVDDQEWAESCQRAGIERPPGLLEGLMGQGLALRRQGGWAFAHGMFRESLEAQSREMGTWFDRHRACAAMLRPRQARVPGLAVRVAHHLEQAQELASALAPLSQAVEELWKGGSVTGARLPLERRRALLEQLGRPHGDIAWGEQSYLQIQQDQYEGRYDSALKWSAFAMQGVQKYGWKKLLPAILRETSVVHYKKGDMANATRFIRHARAHATQLGDARLTAECTDKLGMMLRITGDLDLADQCFQAASTLYRRLGDYRPSDEGAAVVGRALVAQQRGDTDSAERWFRRGIEVMKGSGHQRGLATSVNGLAEVARLKGDYARAEGLYRQVLGIHQALGSNIASVVQLNLALVQLQQRQFHHAQASLEPLIRIFEDSGSKAWLGCVHVFLLPCFADRRDWDTWDHHFSVGFNMITASGMADGDLAWPLVMAGEILVERGMEGRARQAFEFARAQYEALGRSEQVAELDATLDLLPKA